MMDARRPSREFMEASRARAGLARREELRKQEARKAVFRWGFWIFGLLLLLGFIADLRGMSGRMENFRRTGGEGRAGDAADVAAGLDGPRYVDPSGLFSVVPPRNWKRLKPSPETRFNVVFQGPLGLDMAVEAVATQGMTFEELVERIRERERNLSANLPMDVAYVGPYRAIKRSAQLYKSRILMLDFITGHIAHHVQFSMPPALYDEYEPVFLRLMQTYEPGRILPDGP
jgi:hypothetical protein